MLLRADEIGVKSKKKNPRTRCPNCGEEVVYRKGKGQRFFPFCSRRCKLIDLGKWLDEEHKIEEHLRDRIHPEQDRDGQLPEEQ